VAGGLLGFGDGDVGGGSLVVCVLYGAFVDVGGRCEGVCGGGVLFAGLGCMGGRCWLLGEVVFPVGGYGGCGCGAVEWGLMVWWGGGGVGFWWVWVVWGCC